MLGGCRARLGGRTGPRAEKSRSGAGEADYRPCWGCVAKARGMWAGNPGRGDFSFPAWRGPDYELQFSRMVIRSLTTEVTNEEVRAV